MNPALSPLVAAFSAPSPWLLPYAPLAQRLLVSLAEGASVADALNNEAVGLSLQAGALRFVPQTALPPGQAYEAFIAATAQVPTRDNLHDFFNGLVWLTFPQLKRRLNELQAEAIARDGVGPARGAVRDALTLFDENAAWLQAEPPLIDALRRRDWHALFIEQRAAWHSARVVCFGHALLEKLVTPRKAITAHAWPVPLAEDAPVWLATHLTPERLAAKPHLPLPVLGVPGWWAPNASPGFYADPGVFRPLRPQLDLVRPDTSR